RHTYRRQNPQPPARDHARTDDHLHLASCFDRSQRGSHRCVAGRPDRRVGNARRADRAQWVLHRLVQQATVGRGIGGSVVVDFQLAIANRQLKITFGTWTVRLQKAFSPMKRIPSAELLDTDAGTPEEVAASLADLRWFNRWFGGTHTTLRMVGQVVRTTQAKSLSILEVAAGSGYVAHATKDSLATQGI